MTTEDNGKINLRKCFQTIQEITANAFAKQSGTAKGINLPEQSPKENKTITFDSLQQEPCYNEVRKKVDKIRDESKKLTEQLSGIRRLVNETYEYAANCRRKHEEQIVQALEITNPNLSKVLCQRNVVKENINQTVLDDKSKLCNIYRNTLIRQVNCATTTFERNDLVQDELQPQTTYRSVGRFIADCFENVKQKFFPHKVTDPQEGNYFQTPTRVTLENKLSQSTNNLTTIQEISQIAKESVNSLKEQMSQKLTNYMKSTRRQIKHAIVEIKQKSEDALKLVLPESNSKDDIFSNLDDWQALLVNKDYVTAITKSRNKFEDRLTTINEQSQQTFKEDRKHFKETASNSAKQLDELATKLQSLGYSVGSSLDDIQSSMMSLYNEVEDFGVKCKDSLSETLNQYKNSAIDKAKTITESYKYQVIEMKDTVVECAKKELVRHISTVNRKLEQRETETEEEEDIKDPMEALQQTISICRTQIEETRAFKNKYLNQIKKGASTYIDNAQEKFLNEVQELTDKVDGIVKNASEQVENVIEEVSSAGDCIIKEIESVVLKTQNEFNLVKQKAVKVKESVTEQVQSSKNQFIEELHEAKQKAEDHYNNLNDRVQKIRENFQQEWQKLTGNTEKNGENCKSCTPKGKKQ